MTWSILRLGEDTSCEIIPADISIKAVERHHAEFGPA